MTDFELAWFIEHSRPVPRDWCPACEPEVDPVRECVAPWPCERHRDETTFAGSEDGKVRAAPVALGVEDAVPLMGEF